MTVHGPRSILAVLAAAFLVIACASLAVDGRNLGGTSWRAVRVVDKVPAVGSEPTLVFESGGVRGFGGCNGFTGQTPASIDNGKLDLGEILATLGGCLDASGADTPGMRLVPLFLRTLGSANHVAFRGDQLVLSGPDGELVFERAP